MRVQRNITNRFKFARAERLFESKQHRTYSVRGLLIRIYPDTSTTEDEEEAFGTLIA